MLIASGSPLVFISRQLGHSKPSMTLNVWALETASTEMAAQTR